MTDLTIRFRNWTKGHGGIADPSMVPDGFWFGTNVQSYGSGLIGPRWGLDPVTVSGVAVAPAAGGPFGFTVLGAYAYVVTDMLYRIPLSQVATGGPATATAFSAYPSEPTSGPISFAAESAGAVYSLVEGVLYRHDTTTMATTAITTPSTFSAIRRWNLYLVAIDSAVPGRIWASRVDENGYSFSDWPIGNYIDVGDANAVTALVPVFNALMVGKRSGWWAVTGAIGFAASTRQVVIGNGPIDARGATPTTEGRVAYWPADDVPALFNGSAVQMVEEQKVGVYYNPTAGQAVTVAPTGRTVLFGYDDTADVSRTLLWQPESGFARLEFPVRIAGFAPNDVADGTELPAGTVLAARQTTAVGQSFQMYALKVDPERPPVEADTIGSLTDDSTDVEAEVITRDWFQPEGKQARVRDVIVQYRAWNVGEGVLNKMRLTVTSIAPYGDVANDSDTVVWLEQATMSPTDGEDQTMRASVGDQGWGAGFRVKVDMMRGVAIREITVLVDVEARAKR